MLIELFDNSTAEIDGNVIPYVANYARVSHGKTDGSTPSRKDEELVSHLIKNGHWTPLAHQNRLYIALLTTTELEILQELRCDILRGSDLSIAKPQDLCPSMGYDATYRLVAFTLSLYHQILIIKKIEELCRISKGKIDFYGMVLQKFHKEPILKLLYKILSSFQESLGIPDQEVTECSTQLRFFDLSDYAAHIVNEITAGKGYMENRLWSINSNVKNAHELKPISEFIISHINKGLREGYPGTYAADEIYIFCNRKVTKMLTVTYLYKDIPLFLVTQLLRHRYGVNVCQLSHRYTKVKSPTDFNLEGWRMQAKTKKDARGAILFKNSVEEDYYDQFKQKLADLSSQILKTYTELLDAGVAAECVREILPVSTQTSLWVTYTVDAMERIVRLRGDVFAQKEWEVIVQSMREVLDTSN
jgi:flavin-dependent thymidylate synthase